MGPNRGARRGEGQGPRGLARGIIELSVITLAQRLRTPLDAASVGYCEGRAIMYANGAPTKIEVVRV